MRSGSPEHALAGAVRLSSHCFMGPVAQFCRSFHRREGFAHAICGRQGGWSLAPRLSGSLTLCWMQSVRVFLTRTWCIYCWLLSLRRLCTVRAARLLVVSSSLPNNSYELHQLAACVCGLSPAGCPLCCPSPSLAGSARTAEAILRLSHSCHMHALCPNKLLTSFMAATSVHRRVSLVDAVWLLCCLGLVQVLFALVACLLGRGLGGCWGAGLVPGLLGGHLVHELAT